MAPPSVAAMRTAGQVKTGIGVRLEHRFSADLGLFARAMHADGQTETYAYAEIDRSASAGLSMRGSGWGRAGDTFGLAGAVNALLAPHRRFLEEGGETYFLGDGRLSYRAEKIVEAYYSVELRRGILLAFDVQRIANPGYNSDRGPASFVAVRLRLER
jgi:high affinity Mn2+ porin